MKRKKLSKVLAALLTSSLLLGSLSACGSSEGQSSSDDTASGGSDQPEKNMTYITCITPEQSGYKSMENIVKMYQEEVNPNFSMDIQYIADKPSYLQKIKTLVASNEAPDLFNLDTDPYAIKLLDQGIIMDLNEVLDKDGLKDEYLAAPLNWGTTKDGRQIGLPIDFSIEVFWYNKQMFEDANVTPPTTFSEFLDTCAALKEAGYTPISVSGKDNWQILRYLLMITYRYADNDFLYNLAQGDQKMNSEVGRKAAEFVQELGTNYFQSGFASADYTAASDYFTGGNSAIYYQGTWDLQFMENDQLSDDMKDNIGYFLLPTVEDGETVVGTSNFVSNSTMPIAFSADKFDSETERFIEFYTTHMNEATKGLSYSPTKGGTIPNDTELARSIQEDMDESTGSIRLFDIELDPATNELIGKEVVSLALGDITVEEFCNRVDQSVEQNAPSYFSE